MRTITNDLEGVLLKGWSLMLGILLALTPWHIGDTGEAVPAWTAWSCGGAELRRPRRAPGARTA